MRRLFLGIAILTGNGPVFSAGADLKEVSAGNSQALRTEKSGFGGFVLWVALLVPAVMIGGVLLRVFWERKRDR